MSDHVLIVTISPGPEPSPRWRIVCPDDCDCDLTAWLDAEGGWPMFDLHNKIEVYLHADVWWDNGVQVKALVTDDEMHLMTTRTSDGGD